MFRIQEAYFEKTKTVSENKIQSSIDTLFDGDWSVLGIRSATLVASRSNSTYSKAGLHFWRWRSICIPWSIGGHWCSQWWGYSSPYCSPCFDPFHSAPPPTPTAITSSPSTSYSKTFSYQQSKYHYHQREHKGERETPKHIVPKWTQHNNNYDNVQLL